MTDNLTSLLRDAAQTLHASARFHKTEEARNRRRARELMRQLEELRRVAAVHGIDFQIDTDRGGQSHG